MSDTIEKRPPGSRRLECYRCGSKKHPTLECVNPNPAKMAHRNKQRKSYLHARREGNKAFVTNIKESQPCMDCGHLFPACCMDFDHRPGETKISNVSRLVNSGRHRTALLREMAKCDLVCSNCHRVRTHRRMIEEAGQGDTSGALEITS